MIEEYLELRFKLAKLYNSWLINTNDPIQSLEDLNNFLVNSLFGKKIFLENHPDFKLIERNDLAKNISVEQIRELQEFLNKTPYIAAYKVAVIYQADLMNINAANSCLKILEDTTNNTYLFLITTKASDILPTIRSRCAKINCQLQDIVDNDLKFIELISNNDMNATLGFLKGFSDKNRALWTEFSDSILNLMNRIIKKAAGVDIKLSKSESEIMGKFRYNSPKYLLKKYSDIKALINDTIKYDLDIRSSYILIMNEFKH